MVPNGVAWRAVGLAVGPLELGGRTIRVAQGDESRGRVTLASEVGAPKQRASESLLECEPKLGRHELVEERVYGGAQVVHHSRDVGELLVDDHEIRVLVLDQVGSHKTLGVKREPADEEGHNHGNCERAMLRGGPRWNRVSEFAFEPSWCLR